LAKNDDFRFKKSVKYEIMDKDIDDIFLSNLVFVVIYYSPKNKYVFNNLINKDRRILYRRIRPMVND